MALVGVLADDLSGALDAMVPFASPLAPARVVTLHSKPAQADRFAIDTETRSLAPDLARERVMTWLPELGACDTAFKKIDSQMRGNTFAELRACCESFLFSTIIIAPAFPEQGRITRGGRQLVRDGGGGWTPAAASMAEALAGASSEIRLVGRSGELRGGGVAICDAESGGDLQRVAAARPRLEAPVLWCGSAGLARALGGNRGQGLRPRGTRRLAIAGSRDPVTRAQIDHVRLACPGCVTVIRSVADVDSAIARIGDSLDRQGVALAQLAPEIEDADRASDLTYLVFERMKALPPPDFITVAGGDTIYRLFRTMGASALSATGEWMPGIAVSTAIDGHWAGITTVSKSGGFGGRDCLTSILESAKGAQ